jgi:hypothetical protein
MPALNARRAKRLAWLAIGASLSASTTAVGRIGTASVKLPAMAYLTSVHDPQQSGDYRSLELRLRLSLTFLPAAYNVGGGTARCTTRELPCPGPRAKVSFTELLDGEPGRAACGGCDLPITLDFGNGAQCTLRGHLPYGLFGLHFLVEFRRRDNPPMVTSGDYVCSDGGAETDRGTFVLWQTGPSRIRPIFPMT